MQYAWHVERHAQTCRRQIMPKITVFFRVRRQFVRANVDLAPLEALTDAPRRQKPRAPSREVVDLSALLSEPLATDPFIGALVMTIVAGKIELSDLQRGQRFTTLVSCFGRRARNIHLDRGSVRKVAQIHRK